MEGTHAGDGVLEAPGRRTGTEQRRSRADVPSIGVGRALNTAAARNLQSRRHRRALPQHVAAITVLCECFASVYIRCGPPKEVGMFTVFDWSSPIYRCDRLSDATSALARRRACVSRLCTLHGVSILR